MSYWAKLDGSDSRQPWWPASQPWRARAGEFLTVWNRNTSRLWIGRVVFLVTSPIRLWGVITDSDERLPALAGLALCVVSNVWTVKLLDHRLSEREIARRAWSANELDGLAAK